MLGAFILIAIGVFFPRAWYDSVPQNAEIPAAPIKGVTLFQILFVLEGLVLLVLSRLPRMLDPVPQAQQIRGSSAPAQDDTLAHRDAMRGLAAITILALGLRVYGAGSDLWIDEISTVLTATKMSALHIFASYLTSNNHLLNTLLVKLSMHLFGGAEWAVRLPVIVLGTATIPAFYWVTRIGFSRRVSLSAALLLSVTYHHIFFSQNARGYVPYLFFTLVSSGLLCRALERDSVRIWVAYVASVVLGFAFLLNMFFVVAAQFLVAGVAVWKLRSDGRWPWALIKRLAIVYGTSAALATQVYALTLPQVYMYTKTAYRQPTAGYSILSLDFFHEVIRGLAKALGPTGLMLLPLAAIGGLVLAFGFFKLFQRHWLLALVLLAPSFLTAGFVAMNQLSASPRFFLMAMFPGILAGIVIFEWLLGRVLGPATTPRFRRSFAAGIVLLSMLQLVPLRHYYATAKQPFRASLAFLQTERRPGDVVISVYLTDLAYQYYGAKFGLNDANCIYARTQEAFDAALAAHPRDKIFIVTTLHRILGLALPNLVARLRSEWEPVRVFQATLGDGEVMVWRAKAN